MLESGCYFVFDGLDLETVRSKVLMASDYLESHQGDFKDGWFFNENYLCRVLRGVVGFRELIKIDDHLSPIWYLYKYSTSLSDPTYGVFFQCALTKEEDIKSLIDGYIPVMFGEVPLDSAAINEAYVDVLKDDVLPSSLAMKLSAYTSLCVSQVFSDLDSVEVTETRTLVGTWERAYWIYLQHLFGSRLHIEVNDLCVVLTGVPTLISFIKDFTVRVLGGIVQYVDRIATTANGKNIAEHRDILLRSSLSLFLQEYHVALSQQIFVCSLYGYLLCSIPEETLKGILSVCAVSAEELKAVESTAISDRILVKASRRERRARARRERKSGN